MRIISTELMPTSGSVFIDGTNVIKNPKDIRERIAVIPQEGRLVPWMTPLQNITAYLLWRGFGYREAVSRAKKALNEFKLEKYINKLPNKLSGGTKRKALVALAVSSEADIIFLDEPTTGLDPVSRKELWTVLNNLKKDHLIILTTHYLQEAEELSDKIAVIEGGKLIAFGTIEDLRKKIGYPYAIKVFSKDYKIKKIKGKLVKKDDGTMQIFSSEKEADRLASEFIKNRVKFSINPTSLEDIFYMLVGDINQEESNEKEQS
ncbi:MAG: ABC transporter related protein [Candidatus Parvarchaeum acidophilus ARMAN-5]|uniref:ABC transporter related protein n=1 Tax=Candidatus Parvarchaeum acidophilus ARMAN-5 TaxID=662762 RepID=D6GUR9_PARA5|nr:MAG: ABC transporter related protein [Candidatus Parvarchaeum acidophilus ARMAN-5]